MKRVQSLLSYQKLVFAFVVLVAVDVLLLDHSSTYAAVWVARLVRALSLMCLGGAIVARVHGK